MSYVDDILEDIRKVVTVEEFADLVGVSPGDPIENTYQKLHDAGVKDPEQLGRWVDETFGRLVIVRVLRSLAIDPDRLGKTHELDTWFAYHGVGDRMRPDARPAELIDVLTELAQQAAATKDKFDAPRLVAPVLEVLLRYMAFYYAGELLAGGTPECTDEMVLAVESLSLSELCALLDSRREILARPYKKLDDDHVVLSSDMVQRALLVLSAIPTPSETLSNEVNQSYTDSLLTLLERWKGELKCTPKGCAVAEISSNAFSIRLICHDESGKVLTLTTPRSAIQIGASVLINSDEDGDVWAPILTPVPKREPWTMPKLATKASERKREVPAMVERRHVFISYCAKDKRWLESLKTFLAPAIREQKLMVWDDSMLKAGDMWKNEIQSALDSARVGVLLVTPDFLASKFIVENELPRLLDAARRDGARILWIPVKPSAYADTPLKDFQAAFRPSSPLSTLTTAKRDEAWLSIKEEIMHAFQDL
jgi:hypothetical protein